MYIDFHEHLEAAKKLEFNTQTLAKHFNVPEDGFKIRGTKDEPIYLFWEVLNEPVGKLLKGTIFFTRGHKIIRGYPKIHYPIGDQQTAKIAKAELLSTLAVRPIIFEEKIDGINIRLHKTNGKIYYSTRGTVDGSNAEDKLQWHMYAKRILDKRYPKVYEALDNDTVLCFEMTSPDFVHLVMKATEEDMFLIDVMKNNKFIPREEREEVAKKYNLKLPKIISKIEHSMSPDRFGKECASLEYYSEQLGLEGVIAKGFNNDQVYLKIKVAEVRFEHWGHSIPARMIREMILRIKSEIPEEEFITTKVIDMVINDLEEDYKEVRSVRDKIERIWQEESFEVAQILDNKRQAQKIFEENNFTTRKEIAEYMKVHGLSNMQLFELAKQKGLPSR